MPVSPITMPPAARLPTKAPHPCRRTTTTTAVRGSRNHHRRAFTAPALLRGGASRRLSLDRLQVAHDIVATPSEQIVEPHVLAVQGLVGGVTVRVRLVGLVAQVGHPLRGLDDRVVAAGLG